MTSALGRRAFTVGNVLPEAAGLYQRFFVRFAALSLIIFVPADLLGLVVLETTSGDTRLAGLAIAGLVSFVGYYLLQAALVIQVADIQDGRTDTTIGQTVARARPFVPRVVALALIVGLGTALAVGGLVVVGRLVHVALIALLLSLLAIVVVLVVAVRVFVATQVLVVEDKSPVAALDRSGELVEDHAWKVFAVLVVSGIAVLVVYAVGGGILSAVSRGDIDRVVAQLIPQVLTAPFSCLLGAVTYFILWPPVQPRPVTTGAAYQE
jgi:hypothetical protein